jgi:hypothetical protein
VEVIKTCLSSQAADFFDTCVKNTLPDTISTIIPHIRKITFVTEPSVSDPSPFEIEIAIAKLEKCKSPGSHQIPAEPIEAGGEILRS